jgi:coproporphyrinogen III oxidase-like Fe-S oxidoreductase
MYELMHHAGASQLTVGIESFSEKIRKLMKKKFSNHAIDYHLEQCGYWGIPNILLMIVGYPGETIRDHQQNIDALHRYQTFSDMGTIFMIRWGFTMHIYQDTQLYKQKTDLGLILNNDVEIDGFYTWVSSADTSLDLVERIRRRVELHEISYNLGYSQPNTYGELNSLKSLLESYDPTKIKKLITMKSLNDH